MDKQNKLRYFIISYKAFANNGTICIEGDMTHKGKKYPSSAFLKIGAKRTILSNDVQNVIFTSITEVCKTDHDNWLKLF